MASVLGPRQATVARELTKLHETVIRGPLDSFASDPRLAAPKGEIVILVDRGQEREATAGEADLALADALSRLGPAEAASEVAKALRLPRRELYVRALALRAR
jgi:16S rRNA (cytidine1402-2'-O)-methyltransferase